MRRSDLASHIVLVVAMAAALALPAPAIARQGGSVPLVDLLEITKPYPNLLLEIRLQLVRAGLKKEQVACTGERLDDSRWKALGGKRIAPYECQIGTRRLVVTSVATYYDAAGRKLDPRSAETPLQAARVTETRLVWRWK